MHILFLLEYFTPHLWWVETVFENIVNWLVARWYRISIVTTRFNDRLPQTETHTWYTIYRVWSTRINFMRFWLLKWMSLLRSDKTITKIYTSTYTAALPARLLWFLFNKTTIITVHEIFGALWTRYKWPIRWKLRQRSEKFLLSSGFDAYHCVSLYTYNAMRTVIGVQDDRLHLIYNWVNHEDWSRSELDTSRVQQMKNIYWFQDKFVLMYFGHSGKSKWLDFLIQAIPAILEQHTDVVILLNVIPAKRDNEIKQKIAAIWVHDRLIQFNGMLRKDLIHKVASVDAVIMPSLSDGFGLVAAEVSSLDVPLIISHTASLPEVASWTIRRTVPWSASDIQQAVSDLKQYLQKDILSDSIVRIAPKTFDRQKSLDKIEVLVAHI